MKSRLLSLGFTAQRVHTFTTTKIHDSTTIIPLDVDACVLYLKSIGMNESKILTQLLDYNLESDSLVDVSNPKRSESNHKSKFSGFFESIDGDIISLIDFGDELWNVHVDDIFFCNFEV